MSFAATTWVMDVADIPTSQAFATLIVFANFANEHGRCYPSTQTVCAKSRQNPKTARAAIDALEAHGLLIDTGRRVGMTGNVKVYALGMEGIPKVGALPGETAQDAPVTAVDAQQAPASEAHPKADRLSNEAKAPVSGSKGTRKRVAEPVKEPSPPEEPNGSSAPQGAETTPAAPSSEGSRSRSEVWVPPSISDLPPAIRAIVDQWPSGAYDAHGAGHAAHLVANPRRRRGDPDASWHARIVDLGDKPLRQAKGGIRFETRATSAAVAAAPARAVARCGTEHEGDHAAELRGALPSAIGAAAYGQWLAPCRFNVDGDHLQVVAPSAFLRSYGSTHFDQALVALAMRIVGGPVTVSWKVDQPA